MIKRCHNPKDYGYYKYGARGITVCDRWRNSFSNFLEDIGFAPTKKHSIDRINNDGNYEPDNCRWATSVEQARNKRITHSITFNNKTQSITDWARELNINHQTLSARITRYKWSIERALTEPIRKIKE